MAQNISLLGASYTGVPGVELPKTGGGTALFADPSVTTAVEADVAQGKIFLKADGSTGTGTATGGGGTGGVTQDQDGYIVLDDQPGGGGGGIPATFIKTLTVPENVNAFQFEYDSDMASYDYVFMVMDFELTAADWLYYSAGGGTERYGYQLLQHKFVLFKYLNGNSNGYINLCIPSYNASATSPASPMIVPSVGSMIKIRTYQTSKYIKAGGTIDVWGINNADL